MRYFVPELGTSVAGSCNRIALSLQLCTLVPPFHTYHRPKTASARNVMSADLPESEHTAKAVTQAGGSTKATLKHPRKCYHSASQNAAHLAHLHGTIASGSAPALAAHGVQLSESESVTGRYSPRHQTPPT